MFQGLAPVTRRRSKCVRRLALLLTGLLIATVVGLYYTVPSVLMKLRSAPKLERMVWTGSGTSHRVIDEAGGWFNDGKPTELVIRSKKTSDGWDRPEDIVIRNCRIRGSIRILGLGVNGEAEGVRASSVELGHTERAQAAAPTNIRISNVEFDGVRRIPIYLAPGVTRVTIENCTFSGWSVSTAIYLDAESADNVIRDNHFNLRTYREVIAVDGSANNRIEDNTFAHPDWGGIYLYRNCGEGGTVRHQTPHGNVIADNRLDLSSLTWRSYGIWLGSRNGRRVYCECDAGHDFGSSADNGDFANDNLVTGNVFAPSHERATRDDGNDNRVE